MPPNTLLEAVQECPNIYTLVTRLHEYPNAISWGVIPSQLDFLDRPVEPVTFIRMPSTMARLEEAYREAVRHAYPYIHVFGAQQAEAMQPVVIAVPDPSATTPAEVLESLVHQLSSLFLLDTTATPIDWRTKLELMTRIAGPGVWVQLRQPPLVYVVDIDRCISLLDTPVLIEALKGQCVYKHQGQIVFYAGSDISLQLDLYPRQGINFVHNE
ncbi:hypothetical protein NPX13_g8698 [Xylaria arbuscula]|uniref:Uncharacterized protein n=1 Tax=Xylaria arbuscula TaxID=114810 RepID=A0A9W8N7X0_9PEZI|nr:hypothetical protein NPX13_g8698 [Xylaria arbuscula]